MVDHTQEFIQTTFIHILGIGISQFKFKHTEWSWWQIDDSFLIIILKGARDISARPQCSCLIETNWWTGPINLKDLLYLMYHGRMDTP